MQLLTCDLAQACDQLALVVVRHEEVEQHVCGVHGGDDDGQDGVGRVQRAAGGAAARQAHASVWLGLRSCMFCVKS